MLPTFKTNRLLIRPRLVTDLELCLAMDRDPMVTQYVTGPWSDAEKHRAFILDRMNFEYPEGLGYWSVVRNEEANDFLGWILLLPYQMITDETEIGWRFTRKSWGHGYASEAASVVLEYGLDTLSLKRIVADIALRNVASMRVAEKIGMQFSGNRCIDGEQAKSYQIDAEHK
ncbi:GNAT family N-acetyltransferase [Lentilitoribacter sp. EG35]|uniref:GNAT family N-acetyltransferase n=1 Tax=Lentilitoribacter sp. EG35 TaxID=3234192 RepID=UPI0034604141